MNSDTVYVLESWIARELEAHRARVGHLDARHEFRPAHRERAAKQIREHLGVVLKHVSRLGFVVDTATVERLVGAVGRDEITPLAAAKELLLDSAGTTYQAHGAAWVERGPRPRASSRVKPPKIVVVAAG